MRSSRAAVRTCRLDCHLHGHRRDGHNTDLDIDIVRDLSLLNEPTNEVEVGVARSGVCDLDLLETDLNERTEEAGLLVDGHRVGQGLVPISQVGRQPDGWGSLDLGRPLPVGKVERGVRLVLLRRISAESNDERLGVLVHTGRRTVRTACMAWRRRLVVVVSPKDALHAQRSQSKR